ncbi:RnfABCDGE type electron transport complex subunit B [Pseudomonas matsuisoli]|uniref:(4Fe-4S)-binding protein n=1 Tax=Pseudomonas matsuisoli TaxID=1515666 RepID=A0A917PI88_9PSED|nr:RnfABCDGE type electron transport complex subunit B [Pseudomonas matsuisoli]GGJ79872.1 (4Fe-4S)-binding protein [Pseudomonas matsuisoli]
MNNAAISIEAIDALLPQTQCGKCGHPGCRPYAEGIVAGEAINKCPPGGQATVVALAALVKRPALPLEEPEVPPQVAFIREAECIGCTKCIQACPTDAILGAAKLMHTVIKDECTGCELCVAPCPVDCIDILPLAQPEAARQRARADQFRQRFESRNRRIALEESRRKAERQTRLALNKRPSSPVDAAEASADPADLKRLKIEAAMARMALTKAEKQLAQHGTAALATQVESLRLASLAAQNALERASKAPTPADEVAIKKAKITAAMSRAQVSKAEKAFGEAPSPEQAAQLDALRQAAVAAQQTLDQLQAR